MRQLAALLASVIALGGSAAAEGRERLAVLMVVEDDPALADSLTDVAIAVLAERRDRELIGTGELRARLAGIVSADGLGPCLERADCLSQVGLASGAALAVVGDLRRDSDEWTLRLSLVDTRTAVHDADLVRRMPFDADIQRIVSTLREGLRVLLAPRPAPPAVTVTETVLPRVTTAADVSLVPANAPRVEVEARAGERPTWPLYFGFGAAGLAVVSYSAVAVTGSVATGQPAGRTRAEAQADLERRKDYALAANGLFVVGTALAVAAVATLLWWSRPAHGDR